MTRIGIDVECRDPFKAIFRNKLGITDLTKHRGKGAYPLDTRKLNNSSFPMPMHIHILSNVVHLGIPGMVKCDWGIPEDMG